MAKTILITGASSGFGRVTVEKLVRSGHLVFAGFRIVARTKRKAADELAAQKIEVLELDVTSDASVNGAVSRLLGKSHGQLDGYVAGVPGKIMDTFSGLFQGPEAPNPQDVADAIYSLIAIRWASGRIELS